MYVIFKELYSRVNQEYNVEKLKKRNFMDFRWTVIEQFNFAEWLFKKLEKSKSLSDELCKLLKCSKQLSMKKLVGEFLLSYGWDIHFDLSEVFILEKKGCYGNR